MLVHLIVMGLFVQLCMWYFNRVGVYDHLEFAFPRCGVGTLMEDSTCACPAVWASDGCAQHQCQYGGQPYYDEKGWTCTCKDGFLGPFCSEERKKDTAGGCWDTWYGEHCQQTCASNGDFQDSLCNSDNDWYSGATVLSPPCITCSGHGQCLNSVDVPCLCHFGWLSDPENPSEMCNVGCQDLIGTCSNLDFGSKDAYGQTCQDYDNADTNCGAHDTAQFTATFMCCACGGGQEDELCNGRGLCSAVGGTPFCDCEPGYAGKACESPCPLSSTGKPCDLAGQCFFNSAQEKAECECLAGRTGATCELTDKVGEYPY